MSSGFNTQTKGSSIGKRLVMVGTEPCRRLIFDHLQYKRPAGRWRLGRRLGQVLRQHYARHCGRRQPGQIIQQDLHHLPMTMADNGNHKTV